jgi:hypothetical protein
MQNSYLDRKTESQVHRRRTRHSHLCPSCGRRTLAVIHRRPGDRLISRFQPVRRYLCRNKDCRWEGILPSSKGKKELQRFWHSVLLWGTIILLAGAALFYLVRERAIVDINAQLDQAASQGAGGTGGPR